MENQNAGGRSGRYVPINLTTVAPFEATAQALGELPTLQTISPSAAIDSHPIIPENRYSPSEEVQARMVEMMHETAVQGSWQLQPDEIALAGADVPGWVSNTCQSFGSMSIAEVGVAPVRGKPIPKRPRNPSSSAAGNPAAAEVQPQRRGSLRAALDHDYAPSREARAGYHAEVDEQTELRREKMVAQAADDFEDEHFSRFISCLERFIAKGKRQVGTSTEDQGLKMTSNPKLLSEIRQNVSIHMQNNLLHSVPPVLLAELMKSLAVRVRHASRLCKNENRSFSSSEIFAESMLAAQCSIIILSIFGAPNISKTVLVEEFLDDAAAFLGLVGTKVIYPSVDPLFRASKMKSSGRSNRQGASANHVMDTRESDDDGEEWAAKRDVGSKGSKKMQNLVSFCSAMYDLLADLVRDGRLSESVAFKVASVAMRSLRITSIGPMQSSAVSFVAMAYASHPGLGVSILNDLLDEISYMPPTRRHLRTYRVIGSETTCIRVASAMSLYIVQVAASRMGSPATGDGPRRAGASAGSISLQSGFDHATRFAMHLVNGVLKRVFRERDSEYRAAVQALLEDMMVMYTVPEWPGADIILKCFSVQTVNRLEARGKGKLSAYARALAIDYLGALASRMSALFGSAVLQAPDDLKSAENAPLKNERIRLLRFFQEETFGAGKENPSQGLWEAMFISDDLQRAGKAKIVKRRTRRSRQDSEEESDEDESQPEGTDEEEYARVFADEQHDARVEALASAKRNGELTTRQDSLEAALAISARQGVSQGFATILEAILLGLQDPAPTVRAKAVRGLSHMQFDKSTIMLHLPNIFSVMENSCRDISTLVRDAALDFLGRFLTLETGQSALSNEGTPDGDQANASEIFRKVFSIVDKRLKDSAVSVRKRAINIFRNLAVEILPTKDGDKYDDEVMEPEVSRKYRENLIVTICTSLVGRLDDPESTVRDVAEKTVRYSLFGVDHGEAYKCNDVEEYALRSTQRLISLFRRLPWNSQPSFLQRIVHKPMMKNNMPLLVAITRSTVDHLHELESRLANGDANGIPSGSNGRSHLHQVYDHQRVACASILSGFCLVLPSLIAPHCAALAPSLTGFVERPATESDILCMQRILKLLECGIPHVVGLEPALLEEIIHDVEVIVCQYPSQVLEESSVRCLCALALYANTQDCRELLMTTANTFLSFLSNQLPAFQSLSKGLRDPSSAGLERNARGALVRLSLLLRYGDFDENFVTSVYNGLKTICSVLLKGWSDNSVVSLGSPSLLRASVRALIHFLIRHRSFLPLGTATVLDYTTKALKRMAKFREKDRHATDILLTILQGFHEMLRNEEERNSTPRGDQPGKVMNDQVMNGDDAKVAPKGPSLAAEEDAEAGYLAVCAQSLLSSLSEASTSHELSVRRCVANILGLLTRQGLVLPATIVSPLFSLLIDTDVKSREDSYRVIAFIADRHSSMLASAALPAIRNCFRQTAFRLVKQPGEVNVVTRIASSIVDPKSGYTLLSPALVLLSRDYRQGILEGLLREFDPCVTARVKSEKPLPNGVEIETVLDGGGPLDAQMKEVVVIDDDDILDDESPQLELYGTKRLCPVSTLVFVSITLACLDYSNGAGLGGAFKQSGGTAAADAKLKAGRDDITEICGIATRIISNSGQAILRVIVQRMKARSFGPREKSIIADHAIRLCLLLRLKNHLRSLRSSGTQQSVENDDVDADSNRTAPPFSLEELPVTAGPLSKDTIFPAGSDADWMQQIQLFRKMMHEDSIEDCDVAVKQNRSGRGSRKTTRTSKRARSKRDGPSTGRVKKSRHSKSERGSRKRIRFGDEDDDDESDYTPK